MRASRRPQAPDDNGNLTSDGTRSYTWDARNQLTAISGSVSASFGYDAFGRRRSRTVGSATTGFLYDGLNPVQLVSGTPSVNFLTGLGIDEFLTRTDGLGHVHVPDRRPREHRGAGRRLGGRLPRLSRAD